VDFGGGYFVVADTCGVDWVLGWRDWAERKIEATAKDYRKYAEGAEKGNRVVQIQRLAQRRPHKKQAAATKSATKSNARRRRNPGATALGPRSVSVELAWNLVAGFGRRSWRRGDSGGDECGVEGYHGDDDVGDHYWFGVDQDAVGQPDDRA
jgi:hypothetical protein